MSKKIDTFKNMNNYHLLFLIKLYKCLSGKIKNDISLINILNEDVIFNTIRLVCQKTLIDFDNLNFCYLDKILLKKHTINNLISYENKLTYLRRVGIFDNIEFRKGLINDLKTLSLIENHYIDFKNKVKTINNFKSFKRELTVDENFNFKLYLIELVNKGDFVKEKEYIDISDKYYVVKENIVEDNEFFKFNLFNNFFDCTNYLDLIMKNKQMKN